MEMSEKRLKWERENDVFKAVSCNAGWSRRSHAFSPELYVLFSLFWGKLRFAQKKSLKWERENDVFKVVSIIPRSVL